MYKETFLLFFTLNICHFLADFTPLSTSHMLKAKRYGQPLLPILAHASVHAILMFMAVLYFTDPKTALALGTFQLISHFLIDVWKGKMHQWFRFFDDPTRSPYWALLGFDQLLHHSVIILMLGALYFPF